MSNIAMNYIYIKDKLGHEKALEFARSHDGFSESYIKILNNISSNIVIDDHLFFEENIPILRQENISKRLYTKDVINTVVDILNKRPKNWDKFYSDICYHTKDEQVYRHIRYRNDSKLDIAMMKAVDDIHKSLSDKIWKDMHRGKWRGQYFFMLF